MNRQAYVELLATAYRMREEAHAAHHALSMAVQLMDEVGEIPLDAPLYGKRGVLVGVARRLDHHINHAPGGRCNADF